MKTFLKILFFFLLVTQICFAQWTQTNGPFGGLIHCFAVNGTNIFTATDSGVFRSTNNGNSWTAVNSDLGCTEYVWSLTVAGANLFAATAGISPRSCGSIYLSTNNGTNWTLVNYSIRTQVLAVSGANLFVGSGGDVILSTDSGTSWTTVNNGLPGAYISALCVDGTNLFAGTWGGGVFLTTDNGISWTAAGLPNIDVQSFAVSGTNLFAGTEVGVFLSTPQLTAVNNAEHWLCSCSLRHESLPNVSSRTTAQAGRRSIAD